MNTEKSYEAIDVVLMVICGIACSLAVIGVAGGRNWSDGGHNGGIWGHMEDYSNHEYQTTRAFSVVGALMALAAFLVSVIRLKINRALKSKNFRLIFVAFLCTSFLSLLVSVAVWGDFVAHKAKEKKRKPVIDLVIIIETDQEDGNNGWHLGWGFWTSVAADVFLFMANLVYLVGRDCKSEPQEETEENQVALDRRISDSI